MTSRAFATEKYTYSHHHTYLFLQNTNMRLGIFGEAIRASMKEMCKMTTQELS